MIKANFDGKRFHNMDGSGNLIGDKYGYWAFWKWMFTRKAKKWPKKVKYPSYPKPQERVEDLTVTYINHSTFLIQVGGINIITDPIYAKRVSPVSLFGPKRIHRPGISFGNLPKIDYIFVSHNHFDHMCIPTIKKLVKKHDPIIICGAGNDKYISKITYKYTQLKWGDVYRVSDKIGLHFLRARHWSRRRVFDTNVSLWGALAIVANEKKLYFAGDTGYGDHFTEAREVFGDFDIALLPIGAYQPEYFMHEYHINPKEAVQAHIDLGAKVSIPMHFNTFQLSDEGIDEPLMELKQDILSRKLANDSFVVLNPGQLYKTQ